MITSPLQIFFCSSASSICSSESKHRAGPEKTNPSLPVILATAPSGAKFPKRIWIWPVGLIGSLKDLTIVWPGLSPGKSLRFSASVLPVTVMQSPLSKPSASKYFITAGVPPIEWRSS